MKLVAFAAAWIAGLIIGLEADVYLPALVLLSIAAALLACLLWSRGTSPWPAILILVALMGFVRVEASGGNDHLGPSDSFKPISVYGVVVSDPEISGTGVGFDISVEAVDKGDGLEESKGRVKIFAKPPRELVLIRDEPYFHYGDRLELTGRLEEPPALGDFDYRAYLANQGIHSTMPFPQVRLLEDGGGNPARGFLYSLRRKVSSGLDQALPEPQASLANALLLGLRGRLPQDITEDFRATGTSHLLAISGLHVGIVLALSMGAGVWLIGRRRQIYLLMPLGAIWLYALLSGLSPSVERAAIMGSVYLLAVALGRPRSILPVLALAAAVMAGYHPQVLKQVSFQLSFTAVAGIALLITYGPTLASRLQNPLTSGNEWWKTPAKALAVAVAVSVAATLGTLPLIAFNFERIPTLGIPATILALPALPILLTTSGLAAIAGLVHTSAAQVLGWGAWVPLEYVIRLVHLISQVPGSTISVPAFSGILVWSYYGVLAALILLLGGPASLWALQGRLRISSEEVIERGRGIASSFMVYIGTYLVVATGLAALAAILWFYLVTGSDGRLHVHFMDVGQGDSMLIVTPEGRQVLVDGGPDDMDAATTIGSKIPFWDRDLDMIVLTHPDEDHFRGLPEVLDRYDVDAVVDSGMDSENPLYLEWQRSLEGRNIRPVTASQGQTISLDKVTRLEILSPPPSAVRSAIPDSNNNGVVMRLVYGDVSFLLTADIEAEGESRLLRNVPSSLKSNVLKVSHHGSKTSTTPRFLAAVSPVAAVVSAGADNPYGHPHPDVTDRLEATPGADRTYVTAQRGDIEFITDGKRLWVKTAH